MISSFVGCKKDVTTSTTELQETEIPWHKPIFAEWFQALWFKRQNGYLGH